MRIALAQINPFVGDLKGNSEIILAACRNAINADANLLLTPELSLWGYPPRRAADLRVVDVYVARLRGKLEPDPRNPELILTVRGIGYASQRMGEFPVALAS